jgi:predicted small secreted protein
MQFQRNALSDLPVLLRLVAFVFVLAAFSLTGCGGSGDDSSDASGSLTPNDLLDGSYRFYLFADNAGDDWNELNATTFDGAGGFTLATVYDSNGDGATLSGTYTVDTDGTLAIEDTDLRGQASADGSLFATTDTNPNDADGDISLGVALKSGSGMNDSALNGTYIVCQIRNDASGTMASRMRFTFDGAGVLSGDVLEDSDEATGSLAGTYTVAADGELDMVVTGLSKDFAGNVSADGNIILILDTEDDGEVLMMVGVKTSSGMDAADFSGDYQMNLFNCDASGAFTSRVDISADGAGKLSAEILAASDNDLSEQPDMGYTVDSDGTLTITGSDNIGQLSSDGEVFVLVDADASSDGEVALLIGIKKS